MRKQGTIPSISCMTYKAPGAASACPQQEKQPGQAAQRCQSPPMTRSPSRGLQLTTSNTPKLFCEGQGGSTDLTERRFETTPRLYSGLPQSSCTAIHREAQKNKLAQSPLPKSQSCQGPEHSKTSKQKTPTNLVDLERLSCYFTTFFS